MVVSADDQVVRLVSLNEELNTATSHLQRGLAELQSIDGANDFYHLPLLLLATGLKRLCKVVYCLHCLESAGRFPTSRKEFPAGKNLHDVVELVSWIATTCYSASYLARPVAQDDLRFLTGDPVLQEVAAREKAVGRNAIILVSQ